MEQDHTTEIESDPNKQLEAEEEENDNESTAIDREGNRTEESPSPDTKSKKGSKGKKKKKGKKSGKSSQRGSLKGKDIKDVVAEQIVEENENDALGPEQNTVEQRAKTPSQNQDEPSNRLTVSRNSRQHTHSEPRSQDLSEKLSEKATMVVEPPKIMVKTKKVFLEPIRGRSKVLESFTQLEMTKEASIGGNSGRPKLTQRGTSLENLNLKRQTTNLKNPSRAELKEIVFANEQSQLLKLGQPNDYPSSEGVLITALGQDQYGQQKNAIRESDGSGYVDQNSTQLPLIRKDSMPTANNSYFQNSTIDYSENREIFPGRGKIHKPEEKKQETPVIPRDFFIKRSKSQQLFEGYSLIQYNPVLRQDPSMQLQILKDMLRVLLDKMNLLKNHCQDFTRITRVDN